MGDAIAAYYRPRGATGQTPVTTSLGSSLYVLGFMLSKGAVTWPAEAIGVSG